MGLFFGHVQQIVRSGVRDEGSYRETKEVIRKPSFLVPLVLVLVLVLLVVDLRPPSSSSSSNRD